MAKAAIQTTLRLDPELYERAKTCAARAGVPLNTWLASLVVREVEELDGIDHGLGATGRRSIGWSSDGPGPHGSGVGSDDGPGVGAGVGSGSAS